MWNTATQRYFAKTTDDIFAFLLYEENISGLAVSVHNYQVEVYTRDEPNAGTDANVSITVEGFRGDTGKRRLLVSQNKRKFQPAQVSQQDIGFFQIYISPRKNICFFLLINSLRKSLCIFYTIVQKSCKSSQLLYSIAICILHSLWFFK